MKAPQLANCSNAGTEKALQNQLAGGLGFEPRFSESESDVLPLNYPPPKELILLRFFSEFWKSSGKFWKSGPIGAPYRAPPVLGLVLN